MLICAAVKIRMKDTDREVTIHCMRHHYAYETLHDLGIKHDAYDHIADGFITHKGEFLDRKEAFDHAVECGQLCSQLKFDIRKNNYFELFSEDLW